MFELTKKTDYGIELMVELARHLHLGPLSLRDVAKEKRLSFKFLEQVAIPLREKGLIEAKEGKGGGYFLKKDPRRISMTEVVEAIEGEVQIKNCHTCAREEVCRPKNVWRELETHLINKMNRKMLFDLI